VIVSNTQSLAAVGRNKHSVSGKGFHVCR